MVSKIEYICCPSDWKLLTALPIAIGTPSMCWNNFGEGREQSYISLKRGVGGKIPPFVLIRCLYIYLWVCIVLYCTVYRLYIYLWVWARSCSSLLSSNTHFTPYSSDLKHHHIPRLLIIQDIQWNQTHQSFYKCLHWIFNHNRHDCCVFRKESQISEASPFFWSLPSMQVMSYFIIVRVF